MRMIRELQISIVAVLVLVELFILIGIKKEKNENFLFINRLIFVTGTMIVLDALGMFLDISSWYLMFFVNSLSLFMYPLFFSIWTCLADYSMFKSKERLKKRGQYNQILYFSGLLTVANVLGRWVFDISLNKEYICGTCGFLKYTIALMPLIFVWYLIHKYHDRVTPKLFISTMTLSITVILALIVEYSFGLMIFWPIMAIGLHLCYSILQWGVREERLIMDEQ